MSRKNWRKKKTRSDRVPEPTALPWTFAPGVPTDDFFDGQNLSEMWALEEAVENFIYQLEEDRFLTWEAVVRREHNLPLTARQKEAVDDLINFGDPDDDQILYINELPRPSEPWYVILNKIVPHLLVEPFRTFDMHYEVHWDGWPRIATALSDHGSELSLPTGCPSYAEVVPPDVRHTLWLQMCFDDLSGLGQEEELTLHDPRQQYRIEEFIDHLRKCKTSVAYFGLTLESLLTRVVLPERDRPVFVAMMSAALGLASPQEPLADRL